jgi:hypothetical protein
MHKIHLRLLDREGRLLGWTEVWAAAHGDGQLCLDAATGIALEEDGAVYVVSIHWVDVNVEARTVELTPALRHRGEIVMIPAGPILRVGPQAQELPPVIVRAPVQIAVPTGTLGAVGTR